MTEATPATDAPARPFRLAVLDVGEPVARVVAAVADLGRQGDAPSVTTVVAHTGDAPWFGRDADETLSLTADLAEFAGGAPLSARTVVDALREAGVDGVWLGLLPAGLDPVEFTAVCEDAGLGVAGPSSRTRARLADVDALAAEIGLGPLDLAGAPRERTRIVDVDLVASPERVLTLPPRDIVVRDHTDLRGEPRALVAEFPAAGLPTEVESRLDELTRRLAQVTEYRGGATVRYRVAGDGTIELLSVDTLARADQAILDEALSTRLLQMRVGLLLGLPLDAELPPVDGHAIGVTLLARADEHGTATTSKHRVRLVDLPTGIGVRAEVSPRVGDVIGTPGDDVVTSIGAWGRDREQARTRLLRALERTTVVLDGAVTNRSELLLTVGHPDLAAAPVDELWSARRRAELTPAADPVALVAAAVEAYEADLASVRATFLASAARGRPERPEEVGTRLTLDYRGVDVAVAVERRGPDSYHVVLTQPGASAVEVDVRDERLGRFERRLTCRGRRHRVVATEQGASIHLEIDGLAHTVTREDGMAVRTPRPALVAELHVAVGDEVRAGQQVATLESMKMLSSVVSPYDGIVTSVGVLPNTQVERGATLMRVRGEIAQADAPGDDRLDLSTLAGPEPATAAPDAVDVYHRLRDYLLGYDLSAAALKALLAEQKAVASAADPGDAPLVAAEDALLDLYADLASLYRPRTEGEDVDADGFVESADTQEYFLAFLQWLDADRAGLPQRYRERLARALSRYGVDGLAPGQELDAATLWMFRSFSRVPVLSGAITTVLERRVLHATEVLPALDDGARGRLERLALAAEGRAPAVASLARDTVFALFEEPTLEALVEETRRPILDLLDHLKTDGAPTPEARAEAVRVLGEYPHPLRAQLLQSWIDSEPSDADLRAVLLESSLRRYYRQHELENLTVSEHGGVRVASADYVHEGRRTHVVTTYSALLDTYRLGGPVRAHLEAFDLLSGTEAEETDVVVGVLSWRRSPIPSLDDLAEAARAGLEKTDVGRPISRVDLTVTSRAGVGKEHTRTQHVSFMQDGTGAWIELPIYRNLHPTMAERLDIWRLSNFTLERLASPEDVYLFLGVARDNPSDRRLFALVEARDLTRVVEGGRPSYPRLQRLGLEALAAMRSALATFPPRQRPAANRLMIVVRPPWTVPAEEWPDLARDYEPLARGVGLEKVVVHVRVPDPAGGDELVDQVIYVEGLGRRSVSARIGDPGPNPVRPLTRYAQKVLTARRFGAPYPYEIIRMLTPGRDEASAFPPGEFTELDLDDTGTRLVPVQREAAVNSAHLVVGEITTYTDVVPEGMTRVAILSDPTQGLGNLSEPECVRINAALAHAAEKKLPVEWYAVSSGALIALDSGTENMDWISLTLRRIIEFTQAGGEINIIVTGINVGGQPYWNAEATMLMHTKGILIMTPASQMVLTGKQALDFSGAVSAEDNSGIGGYDRIMGPNGQAQYWAPSFEDACALLLHHYDYCYVVPGERFPRRRPTMDTPARDVQESPHELIEASPFTSVRDVFEGNPERKMPFDMRSVMRAVADVDDDPLERWKHWRDSDTSIVWDATIGGIPVCLLGLESHAVPRTGFVPSDGPPAWTSGTLFPQASRKTARAINAASGNRPLVVLANLSGFDGSPESMRNWQLEYGAEIGRAVTNFDGPIVFVVVSRYHGGAFVVFSKQLNDHMQIAAIEGSRASVIGGAPAAATVFAREVKKRTMADPRVVAATEAVKGAAGAGAGEARAELADITARVRSEKLGEMAEEFDAIHSVERALRVGSVDEIIAPEDLRPWIIRALEAGMAEFA
ncbi:carboxyl transferase domain-containing protein [Mobilicoccus massiliensis]|uniref:carboxyl transferase domain-containing protein n=1 Tax=Mobilicoccus massiliensis TaxID=1522310 RepID=UPI000693517D|nr:carboxyl transferase domain-containing protein [Mobilicoccus massiliensis]